MKYWHPRHLYSVPQHQPHSRYIFMLSFYIFNTKAPSSWFQISSAPAIVTFTHREWTCEWKIFLLLFINFPRKINCLKKKDFFFLQKNTLLLLNLVGWMMPWLKYNINLEAYLCKLFKTIFIISNMNENLFSRSRFW